MTGCCEVKRNLNKEMGWLHLLFNIALGYDRRQLPVCVNLQSNINQSNSWLCRLYKHYGKIPATDTPRQLDLQLIQQEQKIKTQSRRGLSHQ
jgi:hypothetical protein